MSVRESLQHGPENAPYRQLADLRRTSTGKATAGRRKCVLEGDEPAPVSSIYTVYTLSEELHAVQQGSVARA